MCTGTIACVNSTTGLELGGYMCGAYPATSYACNTHSCTAGCALALAERWPCSAFYEDIRSGYDSASIQQATCEELYAAATLRLIHNP